MKKFIIQYYLILLLLLFIIDNIILQPLKISGYLYNALFITFTLLHMTIIIKHNKDIKCKELFLGIIIFLSICSKNQLYLFYCIFMAFLTIITNMASNKNIRIMAITFLARILLSPLSFVFIFLIAFDSKEENSGIYPEYHYYCEDNYEIYYYSAGAMDRFHYMIGKHYEILQIDDIIKISYHTSSESTLEEYNFILNNNQCALVGDKNESK